METRRYDIPTRRSPKASSRNDTVFNVSELTTAYEPEMKSTPPTPISETILDTKKAHSWFFRRRISPATTQKEQASDDDGTWGPLGLRLLHSSPEPLIDLIFVHGLRGGSVKTWRKGNDPWLFWPQRWLPMDPDLYNVSIHSFGYESNWGSKHPSILNVHDFGKALYEEMKTSPFLRQNPNSPVILLGHSMGGLVIKKAYILAHLDAGDSRLADRIRSIFFLATPHRGSDYASILNRVLKIAGVTGMTSSREYVSDIMKGSTSAQLINEDFGRHANSLPIYSFFETLETSFGFSSALIVDRESAVLGTGFRNETSRYMNANHRDICKFESPNDSNYLSLKNTIASTVQHLLKDVFLSEEKDSKAQMRLTQTFLGVSGLPDEHHQELEGSCQWIDEREDFREWRDAVHEINAAKDIYHSPSIYWVNAGPGAGKTVLAAYVSSQLQEFRLQHTVYHFHFGKKDFHSLAGSLRSIAFQMANSSAAVRDAMARLSNEGKSYDLDDARAVWSNIFRAAILQVPIYTPQYWVIDAIDECVKYTDIFSLLKGTQCRFPLRIFITSRKSPEINRLARQLEGCTVSIVEIPVSDTMRDIELFVRSRIEFLPIDDEMEKQKLREEILSKSNASFLWVRLVMDELEGVYGYESIISVLQGIPEGMMSYYQRTVADMAQNKREKHIAKGIILWVVSAARPLSISELSEALKLDINIHLPSAKAAIEGLCGQLVSVDKHTDLVQIVHASAREFLLSDDAGEFKISSAESHERIALTCLELLIGPAMQPPKHRSLLGQRCTKQTASPLLDYAITQFSEHLYSASSESDKLLVGLHRFLSTTVLSWIEKVVSKKVLHHLIRAARNFRGYLDRRAEYCSPLNRHVQVVDSWTADLSRLVIKFGRALSLQPQSIYFLIPPLCPTKTALYQQFGRTRDGLICSGFDNTNWDDCAATINFENESAAVICCDNSLIAVGCESGNICLYNHGSCQREQVITQDSAVDLLLVDPLGSFVASTGIKFLTVWDAKGSFLWKKRLRSRCIFLTSSSNFIMGITMSGRAFRWAIANGDQLEEHRYPYRPLDTDLELRPGLTQAPFAASVSPGLELLALAYRAGPICIYELQTDSWIAWAVEDNGRRASQLAFNPNPEVSLLLVAYDDSHLALYDSWSGFLVRAQASATNAVFTSLSCAPDGRTFGTVDVLGNLQIWDFESLTILYHILTPKQSFRILGFTSDSFNLVDVTQHEMRIWSPPALLRKTVEEEASMSDQAAVLPVTEGQFQSFQFSKIRSTIAHQVYPAVFAGNHNGEVILFNSDDGCEVGLLYSHQKGAVVKCLAVTKSNVIASGDINGTVQVWRLDTSRPTGLKADKVLFQVHFTTAICNMLFDPAGEHLLVSTTSSDYVYNVATGNLTGSLPSGAERGVWKWIVLPGPKYDSQFALLSSRKLVTYSAKSFPTEIGGGHITLDYSLADGSAEVEIDSAVIHAETLSLILDVRQQNGYITSSSVFIFDLPSLRSEAPAVSIQPVQTLTADMCMHFLGISRVDRRLVFLHQNSWVSSIDLLSRATLHYTQHFFVPSEFITNSHNILPMQTSNDSFVFTLYDKLVVIKNGLKFQELKILGQDT